ncbi:cell wall-binding repeat-containing protein [Sutcliffiella horikoshii]|uniref:cell wall-binding repeat-containing protein n=1 Tax=Sutcliffiella horikoshii TaxID=79883 RepID=UPI003CF0AC4C
MNYTKGKSRGFKSLIVLIGVLMFFSSLPLQAIAEFDTQSEASWELGDYELISEDRTISEDHTFTKLVVIAPHVTLKVDDGVNVQFSSHLVIYGTLANYGSITMNKTNIYANYLNLNGMVMSGGSHTEYGRIEPVGSIGNVDSFFVKHDAYPNAPVIIEDQQVANSPSFLLEGRTVPNFNVTLNGHSSANADGKGKFSIHTDLELGKNVFQLQAFDVFQRPGVVVDVTVTLDEKELPQTNAPTVYPLTNMQTHITGNANEGIISVLKAGKEIANTTIESDGDFSIEIGKQQAGTKLQVIAKTKGHTPSDPVEVVVQQVEELKVLSSNPGQNEVITLFSKEISLVFNNADLQTGTTWGNIKLKDNKGNTIKHDSSLTGDILTITMHENLQTNSTYTLTVPTKSITAGNGAELPNDFTLTFKTIAGTEVKGGIYENTTWTKDKSPYIVTDDIVVFPNKTLTIKPGVKVMFSDGKALTTRGTLVANGTKENKITFTSLKERTTNAWQGVTIDSSMGGKASFNYIEISHADVGLNVGNINDGIMTISSAIFKDNYTGIQSDAYRNLVIKDSQFIKNYRGLNGSVGTVTGSSFIENQYGATIIGTESHTKFYNNTFKDNHYGIHQSSNVHLFKNIFENNQTAIHAENVRVAFNTIQKNDIGIFTLGTSTINHNDIKNNQTGLLIHQYSNSNLSAYQNNFDNLTYNVDNQTKYDRNLENNYWGTTNETIIKNKIHDGYDDVSKGVITYKPFHTKAASIVDKKAPVWPDDAKLHGEVYDHHVQLSWSGATDEMAVKSYHIYMNGSLHDTVNFYEVNEYWNYITVDDLTFGDYQFKIEAEDFEGNVTKDGPELSFSIQDTKRPEFPNESKLTIVKETETSVKVEWPQATDNVGIKNYQVFQDGTRVATLKNSETNYTFTELQPGVEYTLEVRAFDTFGNWVGLPKLEVITVDSKVPVWPAQSQLAVKMLSDNSLELSWPQATDNIAVTNYAVYQNGQLLTTLKSDKTSFKVNELLYEKTYNFYVVAFDQSGNQSAKLESKPVPIRDKTAPVWPTDAGFSYTDIGYNTTYLLLSHFPVEENDGMTFKIFLNGEEKYTTTKEQFKLSDLKPGTFYEVKVEAVDKYGNQSINGPTLSFKTWGIARLSGPTRYETAIEISKEGWKKSDTVILARADSFPDALAGAPLAYKLDAPILLTKKDALTYVTKEEIKRLGAKKVIILGGTSAVSSQVARDVEGMGLMVERISGANRYDTANQIAKRVGKSKSEKVVLAYGKNFPDALSVASYAASNGYPILLTDKDSVTADTKKLVKEYGKGQVIVVGGEAVISKKAVQSLKMANILRIAGANRFETATKLINELDMNVQTVFIANGNGFADALTGSVLAAKKDAVLILTKTNNLPTETNKFVIKHQAADYTILGGPAAINNDVLTQLHTILNMP